MSVTVRGATTEDASTLVDLWGDVLRRADRSEQIADVQLIIKAAASSTEQQLFIAELSGEIAGGVFTRIATLSPLNLEPCVQSFHLRVFPRHRRHGVARALMEAVTAFGEDNGVRHVTTTVPSTSRESQRFMARLGMAPVATYRSAPASVVRTRLRPQRAAGAPRVLAARRQRRARDTQPSEVVGGSESLTPQ